MPTTRLPATPNVLLLFVDQLRGDTMGCAGHPAVRTPQLDRLAAEGTRFRRGYTSVPVCIAARHALLYGHRCATTGRFANNVPALEPQLYSLPQLLANAGYLTRAIGKMHWRPVRRHHGFDRMELMEEIPDWRQDDEYLLHLQANGYGHVRAAHGIRHLLYMMPQRSVLPAELHGSHWVADRTIEFLAENRMRPFFCWSSWISPHPPFNAPEPWADMYGNDEIDAFIAPERDLATLPPALHYLRGLVGTGRVNRDCWRRIRALYQAQVSFIDYNVGRILHALEALDLADNTLVLFCSDHGEMLGDQGIWQKSSPYDGSARVPFLMRLPGRVAAGRESDELVTLLDILPTCLDLAGLAYPGDRPLAGASLLGRDGGGLAATRESIVVEHGRPPQRWLSLLRESRKYNLYLEDGWEELYDLAADPDETNNLLLGDQHRAVADEMRRELVGWEAEHGYAESLAGDDFATGEPRSVPERNVGVNIQLPRWVDRLPGEEAARMNSLGEEMAQVLAGEDSFSIEQLDLEQWVERGGEICADALPVLRGRRE